MNFNPGTYKVRCVLCVFDLVKNEWIHISCSCAPPPSRPVNRKLVQVVAGDDQGERCEDLLRQGYVCSETSVGGTKTFVTVCCGLVHASHTGLLTHAPPQCVDAGCTAGVDRLRVVKEEADGSLVAVCHLVYYTDDSGARCADGRGTRTHVQAQCVGCSSADRARLHLVLMQLRTPRSEMSSSSAAPPVPAHQRLVAACPRYNCDSGICITCMCGKVESAGRNDLLPLDPPNNYHGSCGTCKPNRSFDPDYKSNRTDWSTVDDGFGTAAAFDQYLDVAALLYITMKQTSTPTPILLDKCTAAQWDALLADGPYYASTSRRRSNEREAEKNRWKRCLHVHGDETIAALLEKRCLPESGAAAGGPKRPRGTGSGGGMGGGGSG